MKKLVPLFLLGFCIAIGANYGRAAQDDQQPASTGQQSAEPSPVAEAQTADATKWLFSYAGKPSSELAADPQFGRLLQKFFPKTVVKFWSNETQSKYVPGVAAQYLAGNPQEVRVTQDRFITASGSLSQFKADQGLIWVDTHIDTTTAQPTVVFAALDVRGSTTRLWIFSNHDFYDNPFTFPQDLRLSVAWWLAPPKSRTNATRRNESRRTVNQPKKVINEAIVVDSTGRQQMDVAPALLGVPLSMVNLSQP